MGDGRWAIGPGPGSDFCLLASGFSTVQSWGPPAPLASRLQGMGRRQVEDELRGAFEGFLRRLAAWRHGDAAHDDEAADA